MATSVRLRIAEKSPISRSVPKPMVSYAVSCDHALTPSSVTAPLKTCLRYEFPERAGGRAVSPQCLQDPLAIICRDLFRRYVQIGQHLDYLRTRGSQLRRFDLEHPPASDG